MIIIYIFKFRNTISWLSTNSWSACLPVCDDGFEYRQFVCVSIDKYNGTTILNKDQCSHLKDPMLDLDKTKDVKPCKLGPCKRGYRWQVSDWDYCSQNCGPSGIMSREVKCVYKGTDNSTIVLNDYDADYYCGNYRKPNMYSSCNRFACRPEFVPEQWGKVGG